MTEENEELANETNEQSDPIETESQQSVSDETQEIQDDWTPNLMYNHKNQEHEFDEWLKPVVKSKEQEERLRELYTKSYGLDTVKNNLEQASKSNEELQSQLSRYQEEVELSKQGLEGLKTLAKNDFASFAHIVGLDDQTVLNYANQRLDYKEKPEYERQQMDQDLQRRSEFYNTNFELQQLRRTNEKLMMDRHRQAMNAALNRPEISAFAKQFDSRMGEGAFTQHVRDYGSKEFKASKRYVEPSVAVQQIYAQFKPLFEDKLNEIKQKEESTPKKTPTNLGTGRAGTVVKKRVKRLADLTQLANELAKADSYG